MFSKNLPLVPRLYAALFCVFGCASLIFNAVGASAQTKRFYDIGQNVGGAPIVTATLTDSFPDLDGNGRAAAGEEVTYTARITNSGDADATGVNFTAPVDSKSTLVPGSLQMQPDLNNQRAIRCTFSTGGNADCNGGGSYAATDSNFNTILSAQNDYLTLNPSNVSYNAGTGVFQFDVTVQNLLPESLGTLNGETPDAAGVRLFLQNSRVTSGTGSISIANADGTGTFTDANQPYFQYNQILQQDQVSFAKTVRVNVPDTVGSFTLDFFVSTKVQVKVVINEVLVNPGGTILDVNGEWFELYNAGRLPVNLRNFLINDSGPPLNTPGEECFEVDAGRCYRPPFTVATNLPMEPGAYLVFGNTTDTTLNGGVPVDYAYGSTMNLLNNVDSIRIRTPAATGALRIDKTQYSQGTISGQNGISRELKNPALDNANMDGSNWAVASVTSVYGPGGRGTPKAQNSTYTPFAEPIDDKSSDDKSSVEKTSADTNFSPVLDNGSAAVTADLGTITPGGFAIVTYRVTIANPIPAGATQVSGQGSVSGNNFGDIMTDDPSTPAANDATVTPIGFAPTAAQADVSGRVLTADGRGIRNVTVTLTGSSSGALRTALSTSFGNFSFENVPVGEVYILTVQAKQYQFSQNTQVISVMEDIADLTFIANPQ